MKRYSRIAIATLVLAFSASTFESCEKPNMDFSKPAPDPSQFRTITPTPKPIIIIRDTVKVR